MAREDEHPDVLMAQSAYYISKNIERVADSLDRIANSLDKLANPPLVVHTGSPMTLWGKGPDK